MVYNGNHYNSRFLHAVRLSCEPTLIYICRMSNYFAAAQDVSCMHVHRHYQPIYTHFSRRSTDVATVCMHLPQAGRTMSPLLSLHSPLQHVHVSTNKSEAVVCVCLQRLQHTLNARAPVTDVVWQQAGHLWKVGAEVFRAAIYVTNQAHRRL